MGLDQFALVSNQPLSEGMDLESLHSSAETVFTWRKHNRLEGWMRDLYWKKGGVGEFNVEVLELTLSDIEALEADIVNGKLPHTTGFFFGSDSYGGGGAGSYAYYAQDLAFVQLAKEKIAQGKHVFYSSWW